MRKLEKLQERAIKAKKKIETIIPILAKKERIPENFGGREALRIRSASEAATSAIMMLNHYFRQITVHIRNSLNTGELEVEVKSYLERLEFAIPNLEETAKLEPAKMTLAEALAQIAERDEIIKARDEEIARLHGL